MYVLRTTTHCLILLIWNRLKSVFTRYLLWFYDGNMPFWQCLIVVDAFVFVFMTHFNASQHHTCFFCQRIVRTYPLYALRFRFRSITNRPVNFKLLRCPFWLQFTLAMKVDNNYSSLLWIVQYHYSRKKLDDSLVLISPWHVHG